MQTAHRLDDTATLRRVQAELFDSLPEHFERLRLDGEQLTRLQTERLRAVLHTAAQRSPFHRDRLAGVDIDRFTPHDLVRLPPMTKAQMMDAYDDVVTDRRLTLDVVDRHLATVGVEPELLFDELVVLSSGGSSGVRGVFACDLDGSAQQTAAVVRGGLAGLAAAISWPPPGPIPITIVAAPTCVHATRGLSSVFLGRLAKIVHAPVTAPFDDIVDAVERSQPMLLIGYPTVIARLADTRAAGGLTASPVAISVTSEQLTDDQVNRITAGFGVGPANSFGSTEGLMGTAPPGSDVFDFASDVAYVEFVDADDQPVAIGEAAHHVLITNLVNHVQPLIRYRLDDSMTQAPASPAHGHQRASVEGRNDALLDLADVLIHPATIRSALLADASVADYQVHRRSASHLDVDVVARPGHADRRDIAATAAGSITAALDAAGAPGVTVAARLVDELPRHPLTGKVQRFVT